MVQLEELETLARSAGLDLVGVAPAGPSPFWDTYQHWLQQGYHGGMTYLARADAVERRMDPRRVMPQARTVLAVAASYASSPLTDLPPLHGRVARYAWGEDYHRWLLRRLKEMLRALAAHLDTPMQWRAYVDTGPILERAWAQAAGSLGWIGKNTCLIHPTFGSYLLLGVALLDVVLPPTDHREFPTCGSCTRCLDACPTGALVAPGVLDARRCLAYLTIEHRGPIPEELRTKLGPWVFGCDICQDVCPWNRRVAAAHADTTVPQEATLMLPEILRMSAEAFHGRFRRTAIWRATATGLARNAAVVLGNLGQPAAIPSLTRAAATHPDSIVRDHAAWALTRLLR